MFVVWECGCVGLVDMPNIHGVAPRPAILIQACDLRPEDLDAPLSFHAGRRDNSDKRYTRLSDEKAAALIAEIGGLMRDGYRYRQIRNLLTLPEVP
jgi:hypothetical protein